MFSADEKEIRLAEGKNRDLLVRAERWIEDAPHRRGCLTNRTPAGGPVCPATACTCGLTGLRSAFADARKAGRLP